ncbi:MAG: Asp-tRNA(Asn)/Glu-tRNA(Gln) amidotransferase subunit GatC [Verrucomicrobia bacterium]|nr:Asp-tRNA(Asn)/Glu-tRNA(Gln) amidotransferase subunit GatC [Verrucomicrobiota bacterium]
MSASDFDIQYTARLARLALSQEEQQTLSGQLGNILDYIAKLKEAPVEGIEPTSHAVPLVNVTRPDEPGPSFSNEQALLNAPSKISGLFAVPKIVE